MTKAAIINYLALIASGDGGHVGVIETVMHSGWKTKAKWPMLSTGNLVG